MNVINDREVIVYKNDRGKYSVMITKKNLNDEFEKAYMTIQFNKDVELENKTTIKIKNAWLSFYTIKRNELEKETRFFIRCSDFEKVDAPDTPEKVKEEIEKNEEIKEKVEFDVGQQIEITDDDLPF